MPSLNSSTRRKRHNATDAKFKVMGDHKAFMTRIKKSLYYGKLPITDRFSLPITELAAELYTEVKSGYSLDRLDLEEAAVLSRNACVSPCSLVLALLYLERLKSCNPDYLHRISPSELFLVSMLVASKFLQDDGEENEVFNEEWATSAGIDVKVLNQIERDFLQAIEWEVFVSEQAFWNRLSGIERDVALKEGRRRGWFTYTDLDNLMDSVDLAKLAQAVITVSAICLTSYTASVLTLIGSAFIASLATMASEEEVRAIWKVADAVCFDVDSTVIQEEAIDELAKFCGKGEEVSKLTLIAMGGKMSFRDAFSQRLNIIRPQMNQLRDFIRTRPPRLTPGIKRLVDTLHQRSVPVYLVSGGFRSVITPVALELNIPLQNVFANRLKFFFNGEYAGFDENEPTSESGGKGKAVGLLKKKYKYSSLVLIGDGATDMEACPPADAFIGYGGNIIRESVRAGSKWYVTDFQVLLDAL